MVLLYTHRSYKGATNISTEISVWSCQWILLHCTQTVGLKCVCTRIQRMQHIWLPLGLLHTDQWRPIFTSFRTQYICMYVIEYWACIRILSICKYTTNVIYQVFSFLSPSSIRADWDLSRISSYFIPSMKSMTSMEAVVHMPKAYIYVLTAGGLLALIIFSENSRCRLNRHSWGMPKLTSFIRRIYFTFMLCSP